MKIDMHNHFFPPTLVDYIKNHGDTIDTYLEERDGQTFVCHKQGFAYPLHRELYDYDEKVAGLAKIGVDMAALSVQPGSFYYFVDKKQGLTAAQICNDWVAEFSAQHPQQFVGMATLPMQDIPLAVKELTRAHEQLKLNAVEIGSVILDTNLDDERFWPLYEYCNAHHILIFVHPYYVGFKENLAKYYNANLVGNVLDTNMAINTMILGGIFERFPNLNLLAAHAGGYFPYQFGRVLHGYAVREEPKASISHSPEHYLKNVYYDTITHWQPALDFLVQSFGAGQVVIGTDCPFDMGDMAPMEKVNALKITPEEREAICFGNAKKLLGL